MASESDIRLLTSPRIFLVGMTTFLILVAFVALILYKIDRLGFQRQIPVSMASSSWCWSSERCSPTGRCFGCSAKLPGSIRWSPRPPIRAARAPILLGPMATLLNAGAGARGLSTTTTRAILDSVGTRLDEGRELNRYLIGLLVFLGLLGTFWGLLETVHSISGVIDSMKSGNDSTSMFDDLKSGLSAPIAGMSVSFTSSLFGLAGSLILGFLDLQAGQAQNRFYTELEDFLASHVETASPSPAIDDASKRSQPAEVADPRKSAAAMANLAEGIQALVSHMRQEQQQIRDWVEAQASQQEEIRRLLRRLAGEREKL